MTIKILISLSATLFLLGCCSTQPSPKTRQPETGQRQSIIGGSCAGFSNVKCVASLECYLDAEAQQMDDANGICRIKRAKKGEICAGFGNVPCDSLTFCKRDTKTGFDKNGICVERPQSCLDALGGEGVCGTKGNYYDSQCYANLNGEGVLITAPASKSCIKK